MVLARMRQLNTFLTFLVSYSALVISFGQRSGPHLGRWSYFIEQFPALVRRRRHELAAPSIPAPTHTPPAIAAPPPRPPPPPPPPPPAPPAGPSRRPRASPRQTFSVSRVVSLVGETRDEETLFGLT